MISNSNFLHFAGLGNPLSNVHVQYIPWASGVHAFLRILLAVADDEDGMVGVERYVIQPGLFPRHNGLGTDGVVLVQMEVEDVHLQICS